MYSGMSLKKDEDNRVQSGGDSQLNGGQGLRGFLNSQNKEHISQGE